MLKPSESKSVFEIIKSRRSIRKYVDKKIPDEALKRILEAAIWAPSGSNEQAWYFVIVRSKEKIEKIKALTPGMMADENPDVVIIACADKKRAYEVAAELGRDVMSSLDVAMAVQNMMLAAWELGIGSCPKCSINKKALQILLNLPEHLEPVLIVTLGYPAEIPSPPPRRSLEEVVKYD